MPVLPSWLMSILGDDPEAASAVLSSQAMEPATGSIGRGFYRGLSDENATVSPDASLGEGLSQAAGRMVGAPYYTARNAGQALMGERDMSPLEALSASLMGASVGGPAGSLGSGPSRRPSRAPPADYQMPYVMKPGEGAATEAPIAAEPAAFGMGHNKPPDAEFSQYGEAYPMTGDPVWTHDPKTGKDYWKKTLTPAAEEFAKARGKVVKDVKLGNYVPYYDPDQRFDVDPGQYPPNADTLDIMPAKQETIDKYRDLYGSEAGRERLRAGYERGKGMENNSGFYLMGQLYDDFVRELGPIEGAKQFNERFATSMGATTGGADPTANFLSAMYGNYLRKNGLPYPTEAYEMPSPIGGRFIAGNMATHKKVFDEGGWSALDQRYPKRHNFAMNFKGDRTRGTMDEQMTGGMVPGMTMPQKNTYGVAENVMDEEAALAGVDPRAYQETAWGGFKNMKDPRFTRGKSMIEHVNESIERTHRLTGMSREEIVRRGIIRGEIPMYGLAGGLGLGALVDNPYGDDQR